MDRIGVFLRCTGIPDLAQALAAIREQLGVHVIHLSKLPDRFYSPAGADELAALFDGAGMRIDAVTIVHEGESYTDIETVRRTVGYLPPGTLDERIAYSRRCIDLAARLGVPLVTTHMGVLPEEPSAAGYVRLINTVQEVAAYAATHDVVLALETGQETAEALLAFLERIVDVPIAINYDPANLVMYGTDDPVRSLQFLSTRILGVHVKDAVPADSPGRLGREVRLGEGAAAVDQCIRYLLEIGYAGSFVIENYVARRGSIDEKLQELRIAKQYVEAIFNSSGAGICASP